MALRWGDVSVRSVGWSLVAGGYALLCSLLLILATQPIGSTFAAWLIPMDGGSAYLLAAPVPVVGAVAWWLLVERGRTPSYPRGVSAGLVTAVVTNLVWIGWLGVSFEPQMVAVSSVVMGFVLVGTSLVAMLAQLLFVAVRRHSA